MDLRQSQNHWKAAGNILARAAQQIENTGADFLVICTNAMHRVIEITTNGLLGTTFTMHDGFYEKALNKHGLKLVVPEGDESKTVHRIIYEELVKGKILPESRKDYLKVIDSLAKNGAQAVVLGCTEIGLLIKQDDVSIPVFDTTIIHANAAVAKALNEGQSSA